MKTPSALFLSLKNFNHVIKYPLQFYITFRRIRILHITICDWFNCSFFVESRFPLKIYFNLKKPHTTAEELVRKQEVFQITLLCWDITLLDV